MLARWRGQIWPIAVGLGSSCFPEIAGERCNLSASKRDSSKTTKHQGAGATSCLYTLILIFELGRIPQFTMSGSQQPFVPVSDDDEPSTVVYDPTDQFWQDTDNDDDDMDYVPAIGDSQDEEDDTDLFFHGTELDRRCNGVLAK